MSFEVGLWMYPVLFGGAMLAGWIDAIAGGGGMITVPLLLSLGIPPQMVLGTNKLQASFGSYTAAHHFVRKDVVSLRDAVPGIGATLVGSVVGTIAVQQIDASVLNVIIPFLLLAIALYMLVTPSLGAGARDPRMRRVPFSLLFGLSLGFYDGFFGPGVGSFWALVFILIMGFDLKRATGYTKVMNFTSNIVSCIVFAVGGHVLWLPGLVMAGGQIAGARIGSGMVITRGVKFIRPVFIGVVILTTLRLLLRNFW
jgi:uncharacterized protein